MTPKEFTWWWIAGFVYCCRTSLSECIFVDFYGLQESRNRRSQVHVNEAFPEEYKTINWVPKKTASDVHETVWSKNFYLERWTVTFLWYLVFSSTASAEKMKIKRNFLKEIWACTTEAKKSQKKRYLFTEETAKEEPEKETVLLAHPRTCAD